MTELANNVIVSENDAHIQKNKTSTLHDATQFHMGDNAVIQLLNKLEEGTNTVANLRSILTQKTAELNELIAQLELINQAITNVESTTTQIESMLKDLGLSSDPHLLLINAQASLDSAIKSASSLYVPTSEKASIQPSSVAKTPKDDGDQEQAQNQRQRQRQRQSSARLASRIRYKPDTNHILCQLKEQLEELELDSTKFYESIGSTDDAEALQKAKVDLDIAKTIALSTKSNMKRRTILLRSVRQRSNLEEIKTLGTKIRESVDMWKTYARNAPLLIDGVDVIATLDREDDLIARNVPVHASRMSFDATGKRSPTPSTSNTSRSSRNSISAHTADSPVSKRHSRIPSLAGDSAIPVAVFTPPVPVATDNTAVAKKPQRSSVAVRPVHVKANHSVRPRTTSLTTHRANAMSKTTTKKDNQLPSNAVSGSHPGHAVAPATSPALPAATSPPASVIANADPKKSALKPPTQRGPGSTLRLRSMLAKRNLQHKPTD